MPNFLQVFNNVFEKKKAMEVLSLIILRVKIICAIFCNLIILLVVILWLMDNLLSYPIHVEKQ